MIKFTRKETAQLKERFAEHWPLKVWTHGDVATVSIFGGHYFIKKRETGYDWRWVDANPFNDQGPLVLTHATTLANIKGNRPEARRLRHNRRKKMERFELINTYTIDCNDGIQDVEGCECFLALAQEAGWHNVRREASAIGNVVWVGEHEDLPDVTCVLVVEK